MKFKVMTTIVALGLFAGAASLSAFDEKNGDLHITKDCTGYAGAAGGHCTIVSSNLAAITAGTLVVYDQAAGVPAGMLDSNVVLHVGSGDWAVGRCSLDFSTAPSPRGVCTFSDGVGQLAGFHARVNVSYLGGTLWAWDGTYRFTPVSEH